MKKYLMTAMIITAIVIIAMFGGTMKAKADTTYSWTNKQSRIYYDNNGTESVYDWHAIPYTHSANYPITKMQYRLSYSSGLDSGNTYTFTVSYTPNPDAINVSGLSFTDSTGAITNVNCSGWSRNSSGKYSNTCAVNPTRDISSSAYLYVMITYNEAYLTTLKSEVSSFTITKGVGAVIQDSAIDIMNNQNDNTNTITNNQNSNTQSIINNQNSNAQSIINNQNANNQAQIDAQRVCKQYDKTSVKETGKYLNSSGGYNSTPLYGITDYINITGGIIKEVEHLDTSSQSSICYYNINKTLISCTRNNDLGSNIIIPNNSTYVRLSININEDRPQFEICTNGNQALQDTLNQNHTYNNNASENIPGQNDLNNLEDAEDDLMDSLDFSGATDLDITINAQTSSWIWAIVDRLRGMSEKIVLLFTSILGMGIIKMVLNR